MSAPDGAGAAAEGRHSAGAAGSPDDAGTAASPAAATDDAPVSEAAGAAAAGEPAGTDADAAEAQATIARLDDQLRRALADLDNQRKRYRRDLDHERQQERQRLALEWLPVVDNLDLALSHEGAEPESFVAGIRAVRDQAVANIARFGFPAFDPVGQPFDPRRHEAVSTIDSPDAEPGTVVAVVRQGYGNDEVVLRPASVVVAKR